MTRLWGVIAGLMTVLALSASPAMGQAYGPPLPGESTAAQTGSTFSNSVNPLQVLADATLALPGSSTSSGEGQGLSVAINIMLLLTVIALVPSIMLMTTCFMRIMIVLALLRQAIGAQGLPPSQIVTGLALFMTAMVMQPTIDRIWNEAVVPYQNGEITDYEQLWARGQQPVRDYMFDQIEATGNWSSLYMILNYTGVDTSQPETLTRADIKTTSLVPAYMLSELKVAFLMGFRVYLPFLVIDMVIASLLISMSMMMLPPVLISLPFKLMLFILADGWTLVVGSLLESFVQEGMSTRMSATPAEAALPFILILMLPCRPIRREFPSLIPEDPSGVRRIGRLSRS